MYAVSDEYRAAMRSEVQRFRMTGTVGETRFSDQNLLRGSFSIANQCSGSDLVSIGQVYVGELNATFVGMPVPRYSWKGKEVRPVFGQRLADGSYEDVPLGVFTIDSSSWTESGIVVKAYDNMAKLDAPCVQTVKNGTAYEIASIACGECGVALGTSEEEFEALPNGRETLSEYEENDVETWRDLVSWLSQALGCFVTADREGKIVFRQYSQEAVDTIDDAHRFKGASFSDYVTRYTGLSCVNIEDKTTTYYGLDVDDGLTYNLGSNPFLQYGVEETKTAMRRAVLDALQRIRYVPFTAKAAGNPAYDLGDAVVFSGGIADGSQLYCITKFSFKHNGDYEMEGVGQNPALASAKSKSDKNLAGLMSEVGNQGLKYYVLRNVEDIAVESGQNRMVFSAKFVVAKESHVRINIEILLSAETDGSTDGEAYTGGDLVCTATYYLDGVERTDRHPAETYQDGRHVLTLQYDVESAEAQIHTFDVWLQCKGGSILIEKQDFYEVIFGDGLAAQGAGWDGTLDASDEYDPALMDGIVGGIADAGGVAYVPIARSTASEDYAPLDLGGLLSAFTDAAPSLHLGVLFSTVVADAMTLEGVVASGEYFTGTGVLTTQTVAIHQIDEVLVDLVEGTVLLSFSFDGGGSWHKYEFGEWVSAGDGMPSDQVGTIPEATWDDMLSGRLTVRARLTQARLKEIFVYTEGK